MSNLLISEPPLQVLPSLAEEIGLNEAIFLQQIHYWLLRSTNIEEDEEGEERKWVYKTYGGWREELPFWSKRTIQRIVQSLQDQGLIVVEKKRLSEGDGTPWYSIRYEALPDVEIDEDEEDTPPGGQNGQGGVDKMARGGGQNGQVGGVPNAHARSETTPENTNRQTQRGRAHEPQTKSEDNEGESQSPSQSSSPPNEETGSSSRPASDSQSGRSGQTQWDPWEVAWNNVLGQPPTEKQLAPLRKHEFQRTPYVETLRSCSEDVESPSNLRGDILSERYEQRLSNHTPSSGIGQSRR